MRKKTELWTKEKKKKNAVTLFLFFYSVMKTVFQKNETINDNYFKLFQNRLHIWDLTDDAELSAGAAHLFMVVLSY